MSSNIGSLGLDNATFTAVVEEVYEEAKIIRQAAYDATMEILARTMTGAEIDAEIAMMGPEELAQLAASDPNAAADAIQRLRNKQ